LPDPIVRARAAYWRGRAAEASGAFDEMRTQYEAAARYRTAYYGQLARARLELGGTGVPTLPLEPVSEGSAELLRAAEILAMDEYAFPQIGVPSYNPFAGSEIDRCIVYSIVRTRAPSISTTCRRQRRLDLCKSPRKPDATPPNVIASNASGKRCFSEYQHSLRVAVVGSELAQRRERTGVATLIGEIR
jgi:hypothetical protein